MSVRFSVRGSRAFFAGAISLGAIVPAAASAAPLVLTPPPSIVKASPSPTASASPAGKYVQKAYTKAVGAFYLQRRSRCSQRRCKANVSNRRAS